MTNKVKFRLKITGFELEMEGTRESTALITSQVNNALTGLINPPAMDEADLSMKSNGKDHQIVDSNATVVSSTIRKRIRKPKQTSPNQTEGGDVVNFAHEPEKYGMPSIKWSTAIKSLWLLYVVKHAAKKDALTSKQIIETFNKHFKQAKTIINVTRDLGQLKLENGYWVGEDSTKNPHEWYITEPGEKHVQKLIAELKTQTNGVS
jgi:hypothetical protein